MRRNTAFIWGPVCMGLLTYVSTPVGPSFLDRLKPNLERISYDSVTHGRTIGIFWKFSTHAVAIARDDCIYSDHRPTPHGLIVVL